jgi:WD40 repeat protein
MTTARPTLRPVTWRRILIFTVFAWISVAVLPVEAYHGWPHPMVAIKPKPNFAVTAPTTLTVTPLAVRPGGTVWLPSWTVSNLTGAGSTAVVSAYYLDTPSAYPTSNHVVLGQTAAIPLPGYSSYTWPGPSALVIPPTTPPGTYVIGIWVDYTRASLETVETDNFITAVLTVDGPPLGSELIAFDRTGEIFVMNDDGTAVTQRTNRAGRGDIAPAWSPDGQTIAFCSIDFSTNGRAQILVMNADGNGLRTLPTTGGDDCDPTWSPDGSRIAFHANGSIYIVNADGTEPPQRLLAGSHPTWSPDGLRIAFSSQSPNPNEVFTRVSIVNLANMTVTNLTNPPMHVSGTYRWWDHDFRPAWSPDGQKIAFVRAQTCCTPTTYAQHQLYVVNQDGTNLVRLTNTVPPAGAQSAYNEEPAWSVDGMRIAFTSNRAGLAWEIYVMQLDSTRTVATGIQRLNVTGYKPAWRPVP